MRFLVFASALFLFISCSDSQPEIINMWVNHYQQTAVGVGPQLIYLVQEGEQIGTNNWNYFYSGITGLDYELGYIHNLRIRKEKVENPPADGSSIHYVLEEVISKEKIGNDVNFSIKLKPTGYSNKSTFVTGDKNSGFKLLNTIYIQCNNLCDQLSQELQSEKILTGTFQHIDPDTIKLIRLEQ